FELRSGVDQALVDEALHRRMATAAFAHRDLFGVRRERNRVRMHQRIEEYDLRPLQHLRGAQSDEVRGARPGADDIDFSHAIPGAILLTPLRSFRPRPSRWWPDR